MPCWAGVAPWGLWLRAGAGFCFRICPWWCQLEDPLVRQDILDVCLERDPVDPVAAHAVDKDGGWRTVDLHHRPGLAANAAKVLDLYARDGTGICRVRTGTDAAQLAADTWYAQEYS